jgi:hypothetical protein
MTLDDVIGYARELDEPTAPVLRLEHDEEVAGLVAWFGADRARRVVRLVVRGEEAGHLLRTDLYELLSTRSMGFGDAARTMLPGASTAWRALELVCPEPGCPESPVYALTYDAARPPRCRIHPSSALAPR